MARGGAKQPAVGLGRDVEFVIDAHGLRAGLETKSNFVISGLISGAIRVPKSVITDLKNLDDGSYKAFQNLNCQKKYISADEQVQARIALLMEQFGSKAGLFGFGIPSPKQFEIVAIAELHGVAVISHGSGKRQLQKIRGKCGCGCALVEVS